MSYYKGKIVVITGATSGVGKAVAKKLHTENARLLLLGRNFESLQKDLPDCKNDFFKLSLESDEEISRFVAHANKTHKKIDILIHSAGIIHQGSTENLSVEKLDEQYRINTRAPYLLTQKLLPLIKKAKGQIVFLNSTAGLQSREFVGQYAASKSALKSIADSLRLEVRSDNINVLSVFLGATATPMQEKIQTLKGKKFQAEKFMSPDEIAERISLAMQHGETAGITDITIKDHIDANN